MIEKQVLMITIWLFIGQCQIYIDNRSLAAAALVVAIWHMTGLAQILFYPWLSAL